MEYDDNANGDPITDDNANGDPTTCDTIGPIISGLENIAEDERPDKALQFVQQQRRKQRRCEKLKIQQKASVVYPAHPLPRTKPRVTPGGSPGFQTGRDLPSDVTEVKFTAGSEEKARPLHAKQAPPTRSTCPLLSVAMSTAAKAQRPTACTSSSGFQSVWPREGRRPSPREDPGRAEPEGESPKSQAEPAGRDVAFALCARARPLARVTA